MSKFKKLKVVELREQMAALVMEKGKTYTRDELTQLFWKNYGGYCADLLIASPVKDRVALQILEGIVTFDSFKISHNEYRLEA